MADFHLDALVVRLRSHADESYRIFNERLTPGAEGTSLGVRMPVLRSLARELRADAPAFLDASFGAKLHELKLLHALVLAAAHRSLPDAQSRLARFVETLDNWAVCDVLCGDWKPDAREQEVLLPDLIDCMQQDGEFVVRFGAVMLMLYYRDEVHVDEVFHQYAAFRHEGYYARMGVAWGMSYLYVDHPERTLHFLRNDSLDPFTHNKSIQKIIESRRVSAEEKALLRTLRR